MDHVDHLLVGEFDFVETTYVFPITHMVAPKEKSLSCTECHSKTDSRLANLKGFYMPGRDGNKNHQRGARHQPRGLRRDQQAPGHDRVGIAG